MHAYTLVSAVIAGASLVLASPGPKPAPAPMITPAPVPYLVQRAISPRNDDDEELTPQERTCQSKIQSLMSKIPRVQSGEGNSQLRSYLLSKSNAVQTLPPNSFGEMCSVIYNDSNIPASVSSNWKIYTDKAISVVNSIKPEVNSLVPQCGMLGAAIGVLLITDEKSCKTAYENYMAAYQDHITESIEGTATQRVQTGATSTVKLATGSGGDATSATGSAETASAEGANASSSSSSAASSSSSVAGAAGPRDTGYVAVAAAAAMAVAGAMAAL